MIIAFDIDGTWDRDPTLFQLFAHNCELRGHLVIIVTGREQPLDKLQRLGLLKPVGGPDVVWPIWPIIVSGPRLKEEAAIKAGYKVDVWIDDMPGMIQRTAILGDNLQ